MKDAKDTRGQAAPVDSLGFWLEEGPEPAGSPVELRSRLGAHVPWDPERARSCWTTAPGHPGLWVLCWPLEAAEAPSGGSWEWNWPLFLGPGHPGEELWVRPRAEVYERAHYKDGWLEDYSQAPFTLSPESEAQGDRPFKALWPGVSWSPRWTDFPKMPLPRLHFRPSRTRLPRVFALVSVLFLGLSVLGAGWRHYSVLDEEVRHLRQVSALVESQLRRLEGEGGVPAQAPANPSQGLWTLHPYGLLDALRQGWLPGHALVRARQNLGQVTLEGFGPDGNALWESLRKVPGWASLSLRSLRREPGREWFVLEGVWNGL